MTGIRLTRVIFAVLAAGSALLAGAALPAPTQKVESPQSQFGGYQWLDIHGQPLPFQSDAEIEDFLRTAEVTDITHIPEGITMPRKVVLARDGISAHAIFKDVEVERHRFTERTCGREHFFLDWRDSYTYDIAAYAIDRMLGINRVPPAVARSLKGSSGAMIMWIEDTITEKDRLKMGLGPPDIKTWNRQMQIMRVFNNLIARRDVNLGNTLIDSDWRIWFIDSTRAFGNVRSLLCRDLVTSCERGLFQRLQSLDPAETRRRLEPVLSKAEIKALLIRRDKLVSLLHELIEERGEERVIFDMMVGDPTDE